MTLMIDGVLIIVVLEAIGLALLGHRRLLPNLLAGFMLLIAMRLALGGAGLPWVGASLLAAGIAHVADLRPRLKRSSR